MALIRLSFAVALAWLFGDEAGRWLLSHVPDLRSAAVWVGRIGVFFGGAIAANFLQVAWTGGEEGGGPARGMSGLLSALVRLAVAVLAGWLAGPWVALGLDRVAFDWFPGYAVPMLWPGRVVAFLVALALWPVIESLWGAGRDGTRGGGWGLLLRRPLGSLFQVALLVVLAALIVLGVGWLAGLGFGATVPVLLGWAALVYVLFWWRDVLRFVGRITVRPRRWLRVAGFGKGGSAAFGGVLSEIAMLYRPNSSEILLGKSSYMDQRIGLADDRHLLTIAATRGGKGRSAIIPNLLVWPGSALVIDPKGTNAAVTARARGEGGSRVKKGLGQKVFVVDPFGELKKQGVAIETAHFNPLDSLDPDSERIFEDIKAIADGLVMPSPSADPHWDQKAKGVIAGMIAHVISTEAKEHRTLLRVRDLLLSSSPEAFASIVDDMMRNPMAAGLAREAGADILRAEGSEEIRNVQSNVQRNLEWLLSIPMRRIFDRSDFSMVDLKEKPTTVYLVLPPEELNTHARFLRLFVALGIRSLLKREENPKPRQKVLFVLDEFLALGRMDSVLSSINVAGSYGLKVWPIAQNVNGLLELYGQNWQTFVDGAAAIQVFSIGNKPSADFLAEMIGQRLVITGVPGVQGGTVYQLGPAALRTGPELQEEVDRNWGKQVVIRPGREPLYLNRLPYDRNFFKWRYDPDPDHPGS